MLRRARGALGLTQESLGSHIDVPARGIRRKESGRVGLGIIENALRYPPFAVALGRELLRAAGCNNESSDQ